MSSHPLPAGIQSSPLSIREILESLSISSASNDLLFTTDGREYIDLFSGCGTAFLGHVNPVIADAMHAQLQKVWITGAIENPARAEAAAKVESFFPSSHRLASFYSTGMEAAEFALRIARVTTGRKGVLSFEGSMHGKSTTTAFLGWPNDLVTFPDFIRLPYVSRAPEEQILDLAAQKLRGRSISAVVVEPFQGSSGGHMASTEFFGNLSRLCREYDSLLVVDEIFTGFHRTGEAFLHNRFGFTPDIVLIGKAMGNGFPVSGVVVDNKYPISGAMLPGSTYAGNALACAAVAATLAHMKTMDLAARVAGIHGMIKTEMAPLTRAGVSIRGQGALWILELPPVVIDEAVARIFQEGVVVSVAGPYLRLLPAATISPDHLVRGCAVVREAILASLAQSSTPSSRIHNFKV